MAEFGPLTTPFVFGDPEPDFLVDALPQGNLLDIAHPPIDAEHFVVGTVQSAFFIPPAAWGFMIEYLDIDPEGLVFDGISGTLTNALHPEGSHLEPTIGQIWPR